MTQKEEIAACKFSGIEYQPGNKFSLKICLSCRNVDYVEDGAPCICNGIFRVIEEESDWTDQDEKALRSRGIDI